MHVWQSINVTTNSFPDIFIFITYGKVAMFVSFSLNILKFSTRLKSAKTLSPSSQTGLNWGVVEATKILSNDFS